MSMMTRVGRWLMDVEPGRVGSSSASVTEPTEPNNWVLDQTIDTGYKWPETSRRSGMLFAVGESGNIGISFWKNKPYESDLSVLSPSKPNHLVTLSSGPDRIYENPIIIKMSSKEFLAARCYNDASIYLWDIENRTSRVVYREGSEQKKSMRLCVIDNDTVGYGNVLPTDGVHNVYLLNTSTDQWSLRNTLRLHTGMKGIYDLCYTQPPDGTSCLVLVGCDDRSVMAVEMLGGNIRWCIGTKQIGEQFKPTGVCADTDHIVYVVDWNQHKVDKLSSDDGSVISTVLTAQQHGIVHPYWVQMYHECLYVSHLNNLKEKKWQISKYKTK